MNRKTSSGAMRIVFTALMVAVAAVGASPASGDSAKDAGDAQQLVERAKLTVDSFATDGTVGKPVRSLLKNAKGVYIAPEVLRGAFVVGASGGSGVLLVRDDKGQWNGPAFYTIGQASFGLQAGADKSEVVLLIMSDRGVSAMLSNSIKLGADASIAAGILGGGLLEALHAQRCERPARRGVVQNRIAHLAVLEFLAAPMAASRVDTAPRIRAGAFVTATRKFP